MNWIKYKPHFLLDKGSLGFWQKKVYKDIYADIVHWSINDIDSYTLKIQISEEDSLTGLTINIESFNYSKLDFDLIEKDAIKIIKKLII